MKIPATPKPPELAAPGAGLPALELWIARFRFGSVRRYLTAKEHSALFERELFRILTLANACDPELGGQRVLIRRIRGMEDSSRCWSVFMTLDHLRIVNNAFSDIITSLARGRIPPGEARTADVKPSPQADAAVLADFVQSCDRFLASAEKPPTTGTSLRYPHPWFGPLDSAGWHALGGFHMKLHRRQIERILQSMDAG